MYRKRANTGSRKVLVIHATNLTGLGAVEIAKNLLPELEEVGQNYVRTILLLPDDGELCDYTAEHPQTVVHRYKRFIPKKLSRLLEVFFVRCFIPRGSEVITLGDLPLLLPDRHQTVYVQTSHVLSPNFHKASSLSLSAKVSRLICRKLLPKVDRVVVQTEFMKIDLERTYPSIQGRTVVVSLPPPRWSMSPSSDSRTAKNTTLQLFYPASPYEHKNHKILENIDHFFRKCSCPRFVLTIGSDEFPAINSSCIDKVGILDKRDLLRAYRSCDALFFPSLAESFGLPLIEAMALGLHIIVSDLPYARVLCGDQAIYFDPSSMQSLVRAIKELDNKLARGVRPDWSQQLSNLPRDWSEVAANMVSSPIPYSL